MDVNELFVIGHLVFGRFVFTLLEICFTQPMRLFYTLFTLPNNFLYLSIIYLPMAKLGSVSTRFPLISYFSTLFIRFMPPIIISSVSLETKNSYLWEKLGKVSLCLVQINLEERVILFQSDTLFEKCDACFCCRNHNFLE